MTENGQRRHIVAVDDEAAIRKLLELTLSAAGYQVTTFDRPQKALSALKEGLTPDVILSDVSMPGMNGFEFCEAVRAEESMQGIPFVFLTALSEHASMRQGMTSGADDYLTKPFNRKELLQAVESRINRFASIRPPAKAQQNTVQAVGFGKALVSQQGERIEWDSLKALELFFYFLENPSGTTTFEVAEALWPGKTETKASSSFHTTLHRLRKALGPNAIRISNRRYFMDGDSNIIYDVANYRNTVAHAKKTHALTAYLAAMELYHGDFLSNLDSEWINETRSVLQTQHLELLVTAAELAKNQGKYEEATEIYQKMTTYDPYSESAWESLAEIWELRGFPALAAEARRRFSAIMDDF